MSWPVLCVDLPYVRVVGLLVLFRRGCLSRLSTWDLCVSEPVHLVVQF